MVDTSFINRLLNLIRKQLIAISLCMKLQFLDGARSLLLENLVKNLLESHTFQVIVFV